MQHLPHIEAESLSKTPVNSQIFYMLSSRYCRYVLYAFILTSSRSMELEDLRDHVRYVAAQTDHPTAENERSLRVVLDNDTLPRLGRIGAVDYDTRTQTVRYHPSPTLEEYAHHSAYQELPRDVLESDWF
jgi:hypothetical protein